MKKTGMLFLAFVVGILGGFTLFQFIVRIVLRQMDAFPVTLIGALSMILPLAGGIAAVMLARRFTNKAGQD
ncbi:hypothetical protein PAEVO_17210 [Paenibacillus sp. GM2FR]|uniref:hypothetical protein n=1 Tax=Paenibacillus sp. GM2FR TaxID=2059268 RepID=UPI000C27D17C|nr:hypothetical protein [Paenibacillus sp. GM2FR]PJN55000.1 hypothetical protein PAEVO_17210 [Paenibacillus sp. GM2FR]